MAFPQVDFEVDGNYLVNGTPLSIGTGHGAPTNLPLQKSAGQDPFNMVATNGDTFLTIPFGGLWIVCGNVIWAANAAGSRFLQVGSIAQPIAVESPNLGAGRSVPQAVNALLMNLGQGDTIRMTVSQDSGGGLNITGGRLTVCALRRSA